MKLEGLHHITMITGDAQRNAEFYADVLGLRLVKKTVNFDQPEAYHLYFGDERGTPGSILTWFEFPGAGPGRPGAGMIHTIQLGVASEATLDFWVQRLTEKGYRAERVKSAHGSAIAGPAVNFEDYDGLRFELVVAEAPGPEGGPGNPPLRAAHPEIPAEHAIVGIEGARAYSANATVEEQVLTETLGFTHEGGGEYRLQGAARHFHWAYDPAPDAHGVQGAGTVHHIAWASPDEDHLAWQGRVREAGAYVTDVRDRDYFESIYFREPRGALFEIATLSPGFAIDEDPDHLGEELRLPKMHAHLREHLEHTLRPVVNPRSARRARVS
jgi:glyoxalase family protein